MTRIVFYSNVPDRLQAAAAWLAGAWAKRQPVLVWAPDAESAERLDRQLWIAPATGFLPHCTATDRLAEETPVLIARQLDSAPHRPCLLNLGNDLPPELDRYEEVIEIVSTDDAVRLPARERFRSYRQSGYTPENHDAAQGLPA